MTSFLTEPDLAGELPEGELFGAQLLQGPGVAGMHSTPERQVLRGDQGLHGGSSETKSGSCSPSCRRISNCVRRSARSTPCMMSSGWRTSQRPEATAARERPARPQDICQRTNLLWPPSAT